LQFTGKENRFKDGMTYSSIFPSPSAVKIIRVLVVDDSPLIYKILTTMLEDVPDIEVVGQALNGQDALRLTKRLKPDVILMDIHMPKMDGLAATQKIMSLQPTPIVVLSNISQSTDANLAFNVIQAGALTVIEKPRGLALKDFEAVRSQLISTIRSMSKVPVVRRYDPQLHKDGVGPMTAMLNAYFSRPIKVAAIASSTGGPPVLMELFSQLPKEFSIPIIVAQHILPPFAQAMADWLNSKSALHIQVAEDNQPLLPGHVYISPGDAHLTISSMGMIRLERTGTHQGHLPSATRMFETVAQAYGSNSVGIILTGMGHDGSAGLELLSKAGAHVIAQNQETSLVYSMPYEAVKLGIVDEILPPNEIASRLLKLHLHMQTMGRGIF
jgi:two-component system, chemotaxis family, protein-glutamate methylesterase/glutaminase